MMKKPILFIFILTALFGLAIVSNAQEQKVISPEKERLIAELIVLTKTDQQITEITDSLLESMEKNYPAVVDQILSGNNNFSLTEKENLKERMIARFQSFSKKFRKRLPEEIDYPGFIREAVYPLYDKFFTEKELSDLVAFYRTDTGQKIVNTMPQLFAETQEMTRVLLLPKIIGLADKILKEELPASPPPPRKK